MKQAHHRNPGPTLGVLVVLATAAVTPTLPLIAAESDLWTTTSGPSSIAIGLPFQIIVGYGNDGPDPATSAYVNHYFVPPVGLDVFVDNTVNGDGSMYDELLASAEGSDTLGNAPFLVFDGNYCEEVLLQLQRNDDDSDANPVEGLDPGVAATFSYQSTIPMEEASSSTVSITEPESLAQSFHGNITSVLDAASKNAFSRGSCEKNVGSEDEEICAYISDNCFGARVSQLGFPMEAELELVDDGTADPTLGCEEFVGFTPGNIALLRRGYCEFGVKAFNAELAGAVAVFMVNDGRCGDFPTSDQCVLGMLAGDVGYLTNIPTIQVSQADGEEIITAVEAGQTVRGVYGDPSVFNAQTTVFLSDAADEDPDDTNDDSLWSHSVGGPGCSTTIDPLTGSFSPAGGTGSITITTGDGCSWSAATVASWISFTTGASGTGSGQLGYAVDVNLGPGRAAVIEIAGREHFVSQQAGNGCFDAIDPEQVVVPGDGGLFAVDLLTQNGCEWSAIASEFWIEIEPPITGEGSATIGYSVGPNASRPRDGAILVNDQIHTITQLARTDCDRGSVPDDGLPENGYGCCTASTYVQKFTPPTYPALASDVCVAFSRDGSETALGYDVVIYDDDGPGGGPGTLLAMVPSVAGGVPLWPDHVFRSIDVVDAGVAIDEGALYVGIEWDESAADGFFLAADESTTTDQAEGYFSSDGTTWTAIADAFPSYRSLMIRFNSSSFIDGDWVQVVGQAGGGGNGFGDASNRTATSLASFDGALYTGTHNTTGCEIHRSATGLDWTLVNQPGWGSPDHDAVGVMISWQGSLYVSTLNSAFGTSIYRMSPTLQWTGVEHWGFGDSSNVAAPSGAVFDDDLYFGTENIDGCEIWRSGNGLYWTQSHINGFGDPENEAAVSMAVHSDHLYAGTRNLDGAQLWRSPDGVVWFPMVTDGFGSNASTSIPDLAVFGSRLYAGVSNATTGAQIWSSSDGVAWQPEVTDGFGDAANSSFDSFAVGGAGIYAAVSGPTRSGAVWFSGDGAVWTPSSSPGFTNSENLAVSALGSSGGRIFAGTSNPSAGCEVWRGPGQWLFIDGFESGDTEAWAATLP